MAIKYAYIHPRYRQNEVHRHDIAILHLSENILLKRYIRSINLSLTEYRNEYCNESVRFYGFGKTFENDDFHNEFWKKKLQWMTTKIVNWCAPFLQPKRRDDYLITKSQLQTTFFGDSGGVLVGPDGKQIGVATGLGRTGSDSGYHNYFVKISNNLDFIHEFL